MKVERFPKFDRDGIAMRLAGATIRREAVVFSFLFEFRVLVDSCEKLLEDTACVLRSLAASKKMVRL